MQEKIVFCIAKNVFYTYICKKKLFFALKKNNGTAGNQTGNENLLRLRVRQRVHGGSVQNL